jgi:phage/plasmid-like protein (TIGR03299 family)
MAHEVYQVNGKDSMAYVGSTPWHGLGQSLTPGADIDTWIKEAGMEWTIHEGTVLYLDHEDEARSFGEQKVLYRSDTGDPLSIVHQSYNVVQPREVVEFYRDLVAAGGMTLETAGTLRHGRIAWALARIGKDFDVSGKDKDKFKDQVQMYALLATSCDKSMASTGRLTSVRVVCKNTMDCAYGSGLNIAKVNHRAVFDQAKQDEIKQEMGLIHSEIDEREKEMKSMATTSLKKEDAIGFFLTLLSKRNQDGSLDISEVSPKAVDKLYTAYKSSPGSNLPTAKDTLWGAVNAVTYSVDHNANARSDETRLDNAWFGQGRAMKAQAFNVAQEVVLEKRDASLLDTILEQSKEYDAVEDLLAGFNARQK